MASDIECLHHVGMVVVDMGDAIARYRDFGFAIEPPSFPALPSEDGALKPLGAAQTASRLARNFIEIVSVVTGEAALPESAILVPIQAPPDQREKVRLVVEKTMAGFTAMLADHEGLHRLVFSSPDVDLVAQRLTAAGVSHSGVTTTQRPVDDGEGRRIETIRHLEIRGAESDSGEAGGAQVLLAVAERESLHDRRRSTHPNAATDLVESVLCVDAAALTDVVGRYETYLDRSAAGSGSVRTFELDGSRFTVVADTELATLLPGERPAALPALVAYAVEVPDVDKLRRFLDDRGVPVATTASGDPFIPSAAALGAAIVFRAAV